MAADSLEVRMAHLEGAYEQIDRRLGAVEAGIQALRVEVRQEIQQVRQEMQQLRTEIQSVRGELHATRSELLGRMDRQFFWIPGLLVISILVPIALRFTGP